MLKLPCQHDYSWSCHRSNLKIKQITLSMATKLRCFSYEYSSGQRFTLVVRVETPSFSCGSTQVASNLNHTNSNSDHNIVMTAYTSISDHIVNSV